MFIPAHDILNHQKDFKKYVLNRKIVAGSSKYIQDLQHIYEVLMASRECQSLHLRNVSALLGPLLFLFLNVLEMFLQERDKAQVFIYRTFW